MVHVILELQLETNRLVLIITLSDSMASSGREIIELTYIHTATSRRWCMHVILELLTPWIRLQYT